MIDLRGRRLVPAPAAVLADPSGRRARLLARGGRGLAVLFLLWLVGLGLAGLGILPEGDIPLGRALAVGPEPPALTIPPAPRTPSSTDAAPAQTFGATARDRGGGVGVRSVRPGSSATRLPPVGSTRPKHHSGPSPTTLRAPGTSTRAGSNPTSGTSTLPGVAAGTHAAQGKTAAPGQTHSQSTLGHMKTTSPGHSGAPPGQVKGSTTPTSTTPAPGTSGSARANARGHNNH